METATTTCRTCDGRGRINMGMQECPDCKRPVMKITSREEAKKAGEAVGATITEKYDAEIKAMMAERPMRLATVLAHMTHVMPEVIQASRDHFPTMDPTTIESKAWQTGWEQLLRAIRQAVPAEDCEPALRGLILAAAGTEPLKQLLSMLQAEH